MTPFQEAWQQRCDMGMKWKNENIFFSIPFRELKLFLPGHFTYGWQLPGGLNSSNKAILQPRWLSYKRQPSGKVGMSVHKCAFKEKSLCSLVRRARKRRGGNGY